MSNSPGVEVSVTLLSDSNPHWVGRIGQADTYVMTGILCSNLRGIPSYGSVLGLCPTLLHIVAIWILTSPEPSRPPCVMRGRLLARGVSLFAFAAEGVLVGLSYLSDANSLILRGAAMIPANLQLILGGFLIASLATRIPDLRLAKQIRFFCANLAALGLLFGVLSVWVSSEESVEEALNENSVILAGSIGVFVYFWYVFFQYLMVLSRFSKLTRGALARTNAGD